MNIRIDKIEDINVLEKERIVFSVLADENIGKYLILKSRKIGKGNAVSSRPASTFWFQDKEVKKGDLVVLYSKIGLYKSTLNEDGTTSHFFYWNQTVPIWNQDYAAVLIAADEWDFKFLEERTA